MMTVDNITHEYCFKRIATMHSCYGEKFGTPRQPGLVRGDQSRIVFDSAFDHDYFRGLEGFSHLWVMFVFHQLGAQETIRATVRPPRLGGNQKVGVFASRSMFRPNPLGLSVLQLDGIECVQGKAVLHVQGADMVNGTPILDIKPYLPYVEAINDATAAYAETAPTSGLSVEFTTGAEKEVYEAAVRYPDLKSLIVQILRQNPRPAYHTNSNQPAREYAMKLYDFDLTWRYCDNSTLEVISVR